jgi:ubiquinone/menaquinone biosynthesis C-methylase UbiE
MTFWDFCAPIYDFVEHFGGGSYDKMVYIVKKLTAKYGETVYEAAAGTAEIGVNVAPVVKSILCTDISDSMLKIAKKKIRNCGLKNITVKNASILKTGELDNAYDVVIAGQVLHLLDEPEKAAAELKRIAKKAVILPLTLTKNLTGIARAKLKIWELFGFSPKVEFDKDSYKKFIKKIGFDGAKFIQIPGQMPMCIAVWEK